MMEARRAILQARAGTTLSLSRSEVAILRYKSQRARRRIAHDLFFHVKKSPAVRQKSTRLR
jgi:hypothetical protein